MSRERQPGQGRGERGARGERGRAPRADSQDRRDAQGRTRNRGRSGAGRKYSAQAPSQRSRTADPARRVAFGVVRSVHAEDAYANLVLPARIRQARLDRRDAGFATELAYGTLRGLGLYDAILTRCVDRPLEKIDPPVLDALRLGAHQLLGMRVPAHAALDATVSLVRAEIGAGASGFVNAVLRRVAERPLEEWLADVAPADGGDAALAVRTSHPVWIVRALRQALAAHRGTRHIADRDAELAALLEANNAPPVVNLVALPVAGGAEALAAALDDGAEPGPLAPDSALHSGGDAGRLPGVREGVLRVQDAGSQLTARALAQAPVPAAEGRAERWLDLCAGPGGKAALLAALAAERGATLVANEVAPHRADLVRQALAAVPAGAWTVRAGDGRTIADAPEAAPAFDRVLVDAPCTGLGALRRRPESRWRRTPADLAELTGLQAELLDAAVSVLAPGGVLAYVTCSPHVAETVVQVQDLVRRHPELEVLDARTALDTVALDDLRLDEAEPAGAPEPADVVARTAQLWPHRHGTDAMFLALLRAPGA
ncbi:transcription antitermination factor NusB [Micrococcus sp. GPGPB33]|uniref:RsmB/NOP family class I SAM-dependent RNA methyltransferase n=1 Tax=Micrococcus TaxID=1269 RepID=UPI0011A3E64B|nr:MULTISPECIES: transcription antitermination factor NusB [Micrococcus]MCV7605979.1 rRNA small subunit methyltransferase B [Micrococcus luteus]MCV7608082.1 rRNA small subunit methyltransferase B [Micrococcus luteus]MCV7671522.1 rRNA small subunit methyltransferase B [Micrococcus luteus]MCV7691389.1 rRNA small subunit methyltransferase B [Micrococcus luteus]MCV7700581.1 rRNA small subunit methyltransferase B [Micrococcus luteus]